MAESQSTAKNLSRVTGWLPHLGSGTRLIWVGFAAALVAAVIVVWSTLGDVNTFAERSNWIAHT